MSKNLVPILTRAISNYYSPNDLDQLFGLYDTEVAWEDGHPAHFIIAKRLILEVENGNNRRILETLLNDLSVRNSEMIAKSTFERRDFHQKMAAQIKELMPLLEGTTTPTEIAVADDKPFTAKSELRDFVARTEGPIFLVDAYVGLGTLDCLRDVDAKHSIRILTGDKVQPGFDAAVKDFRAEGRTIELRQHHKLHDRYLMFNDRCWLVGSSIKDAGKKALNVLECIDNKKAIVDSAEEKWSQGSVYLP